MHESRVRTKTSERVVKKRGQEDKGRRVGESQNDIEGETSRDPTQVQLQNETSLDQYMWSVYGTWKGPCRGRT